MPSPLAIMIQWVSVLEAEVAMALVTENLHHLPLLAARPLTLVSEDLGEMNAAGTEDSGMAC